MSKPNFEQQLAEHIDALSRSQQPQRDLWPGIEHALANNGAQAQQQGHSGHKTQGGLYAIAASIAVAAFVGWFSLQQPASDEAGEQLVQALSQQHEQQLNALMVSFQDQPALTENWQQQLKELDEAAVAIKAALEQDPDNVALLQMLQNVYQQQITLIERVHSPKWRQI
ncbi:hypothetical protein [Aestuariibacter salexigens]|uniref:hypothetical protein n=1 Tax=Aestuariibacter salexigens TaxID=226010 RepID=UPI0004132D8A|nr:hypothetical protein [Aestuariibacter salexigens]